MNIAILTYDTPHLKTQTLVSALALTTAFRIQLFGLPFNPRPPRQPLLQHRPDMNTTGHPRDLARHFDLTYQPIDGPSDIEEAFDVALVAGAGLLPAEFVERAPVINCHGGLIPSVRGLDAFKWAIHDRQPLGNTLHVIDAEVDAGTHLKAIPTPIFPDDSLESLARRHYELEMLLLINFAEHLNNPEKPPTDLPVRPARKRMRLDTERDMIAGFPQYLKQFAKG
jgi:phosphoribosylglycinamide formyltransferase 1